MSTNGKSNNPQSGAKLDSQPAPAAPAEKTAAVSRFPSLEDEYVRAELHNGIVMFADIRDFSSYMDANSDYAISLLACFRRVLSQCVSAKSLKSNESDRYTTFSKELGDGVMMVWIAEQGSITDISVDEITGLAFVCQEIVKRFFELSADFAPEKYHVGIGIAVGSFQRLLYKDRANPTLFRYRDYCGGTINMAARMEGMSRPNGVSICVNSLPLNKKNDIRASLAGKDFKETTQEIKGMGKTGFYQWIYTPQNHNGNGNGNVNAAEATSAETALGARSVNVLAEAPTEHIH